MEERRSYSLFVVGSLFPLLLVLFICSLPLCSPSLQAQTIKFVRTDVDSGRSGFITATQLFGVDIVLTGVKSCTGVSFELQYTNAQYVVYSNWKERQLGRMGAFARDFSDTVTGNGNLLVGVLSGIPVPNQGKDDPIAIHLDFVVRSNTPNELPVSFTFVNAQAVSSTDSGGRIITLTPEVYNVTVHSFVNVFPGDADNNGVVDSRDATTIGAYLGQGSGISNVRGYRREPASTLWLPQRSLIWDSAKATYADCDGSGDITLSDNLVVSINLYKQHSIIKNPDEGGIPIMTPQEFPSSAPRLPFVVASNRNNLLAVACALQCTGTSRLIGFEPSPEYPSAELYYFRYDEETRTAYLHIGDNSGENTLRNGILGNLVFEEGGSTSCSMTQGFGARSSGDIFPLRLITAVEEDSPATDIQFAPNPANQSLRIATTETITLRIVNLLGEQCMSADIQGSTTGGLTSLDISPLPPGHYHIVTYQGNRISTYPLAIVR